MISYENTIESARITKKSETILAGRAVSRGAAIGTAVCLHGRKRQFYRTALKSNQIDGEINRFRAAVILAKKQLTKISRQETKIAGGGKTSIFEAHLLILDDRALFAKIEENITDQKVNAEWAVKIVLDSYIAEYKSIADEHLRERYIDLEDISDRLLNALGGGEKSKIRLDENAVIVAKEVKPSTLIELAESHPKAIITERGGWTSHTFILAREMNLPAVTGIGDVLRRIETGDEIIVDGFNGKIIVSPADKTLKKYKAVAKRFEEREDEEFESTQGKLTTLDGREIIIRTNVDLPQGYLRAKRFGARGVGLYRSEFLFNQFKGFPSETKQINAYRQVAQTVGEDGVCIRTFDLSVERLADENSEREQNPALGLRGIRLCLTHPEQFRIQLRALLQASFEKKIDIVLPMISDVSEIILTRKMLDEEKERLKLKGIRFGDPRLGAMIEVPAAVLTADEIAREADFLSLGTNDLVQYLLAVDRDNQPVADWFRTLHPAVVRAIKIVVRAAEDNDVPLIVCGEMAGSPFYAPILIGLGARILSMNVNSIARVRKIVAGIAFEEAVEICRRTEECATADQIENLIKTHFSEKWSHLYSSDIFNLKTK